MVLGTIFWGAFILSISVSNYFSENKRDLKSVSQLNISLISLWIVHVQCPLVQNTIILSFFETKIFGIYICRGHTGG